MTLPQSGSDRYYSVYLALSQYPILSKRIRELMRQELYSHGIIGSDDLYSEAVEAAVQSQEREGLFNPFNEEDTETWERRKSLVLDTLTDSYFAKYFDFNHLSKLIQQALNERGVQVPEGIVEFNPETAPTELLFNQGMMIEKLPPEQRAPYAARLQEIKVVLIRNMISDQLRYINIAKEWFTLADLAEIRKHKLGRGRIGGKAAGMLLAARILKEKTSPALQANLRTPTSFYIGSDVFYTFISINNLLHWGDQKYKNEEQMRKEYPRILEDFSQGEFPPGAIQHMETILSMAGRKPLIVRSSSLLEDNFGTAFAGKYESIYLPNQGEPEDNLRAMQQAMARIYASTLNPNALLYRKSRGLLDYDERMALLIQVVEGQQVGQYYFPQLAGVGYSRNQYRWSPQIRPEEGFLRLVWGLGTRAVDRVGNDYPRLVALSHPTLTPSSSLQSIRHYSQQYIDLIDLKSNLFRTLPVHEVLGPQVPALRYIAQIDSDGYIHTMHANFIEGDPHSLILTFDELLRHTDFPGFMRELLAALEGEYHTPVDVEFTAKVEEHQGKPQVQITLIQCRPLGTIKESVYLLPQNVPLKDQIFSGKSVVSGGSVQNVHYILYVPPEAYFSIPNSAERNKLERAIGKLNAALADETFICVGPGRWGTSNPDLGVHVDYGDIYNAKALVELTGGSVGIPDEPSLGTHFFQDLLEGQIYPIAVNLSKDKFQREFFEASPNHLSDWITPEAGLETRLRLIQVSDASPNSHLDLVIDDATGQALAFLVHEREISSEGRQVIVP
ncbi:MAG TPA: PEP/pyruvate-binding domain-containing protein [Anaerolineaceae bacterium]|nr:PEP/pyruvate-binding domain-containing protein [Anaerolineaceae bacterium]